MTTPGGVPNLPTGALTLDTMATKLQDMSGTAMKDRAAERFPSIMDNSTGLSPASDITPFGLLTGIWAGFNSVVAGADPADVNGPEDLPGLLLQFIEGLPVIGQFVTILEAILGTYTGDDETLLGIQNIFAPIRALLPIIDTIINALTGGSSTGNPLEALTGVLSNLGQGVSTAINSANQASDLIRQLASYVVQTIQSLAVPPVFGDLAEMVNSFAFWFLGMFGITQQSVTNSNPAVAAVSGRVGALESKSTAGLEGFADHFDRPAIGSDWVTITPYNALNIENSQYLKSYNHCAGRYVANDLLTDTWHVQFSLAHLDFGQSRIIVSSNGATADSSFTNGIMIDVSYQWYGTTATVYTMTGGLISATQQAQRNWDYGVVKVGDVLGIEYIEADNTFYFYANTIEIPELRYVDSANLVDHGVGHRGIAVFTNFADNSALAGPGFDDMSAYDIKVT